MFKFYAMQFCTQINHIRSVCFTILNTDPTNVQEIITFLNTDFLRSVVIFARLMELCEWLQKQEIHCNFLSLFISLLGNLLELFFCEMKAKYRRRHGTAGDQIVVKLWPL